MGSGSALLAAAVVAVCLAVAQTQPAEKTKKSTVQKKKKKTSKTKKAATPRGQQRPTPERYKQIEEALAARGYLLEEPTGKWSPGAVEALRNFQADHELPPTGRLDAQSLIQLGLGPQP